MTAELNVGDLHDAALRSIRIDWRNATALVEIVIEGGRDASIVVTGFRRLECSREQPWGTDPHGTIYDARVRNEAASIATLELEMQTGDAVKVTGEFISLGSPSRSPRAP